jgi:hypothetical protein
MRVLFPLLLILSMLATSLVSSNSPVAAQETPVLAQGTPISATDDQLQAVLPEYREELGEVIEAGLTAYTMQVTMTEGEDAGLIAGTATIDYINDTGGPIESLPIRMYANGHDDPVTITSASVDGVEVEPELSVYRTVATLSLPEPLAEDDRLDISIGFETKVPLGNQIHYGMLGIDTEAETWAVSHWYPMVAGWVDGEGWELDPPSTNGDPVFSTTSTYDVTITAPDDLKLVTSGVAESYESDGTVQTARYVTGPARDFVFAADDQFIVTSTEIDGTTVNSWYLPSEARNGEAVTEFAARSLDYFNEKIDPYPFTEFDVLSVELYGALGVEFPQLIYMARSYYTRDIDLEVPSNLEFTVAHEVLHQWWYSMVGNNQYDHAFIDEGLTNYISGDLYFRHVYGDAEGESFSHKAFRDAYENGKGSRSDGLVDMPTDDYPSGDDYVYAMYFKGAMGFSAIQKQIGEDAFFAALTLYFDRFCFGVAEPGDLLAALEEASGQELDDIWTEWFETDPPREE